LEDFTFIVSHELQSPLKKIVSFADLVKMELQAALSDKGNDYLDRIQNGAHRMSHLVSNLLNYSRITLSTQKPEPTNVEMIVKEALSDLDVQIKESKAEVAFGTLPQVQATPLEMNQLFLNLIGNGIKYAGPNAPRINIAAKQQGDHWTFSVGDNGIGVEPKNSKRIFDLFQRINTEGQPGNGIGLTLCRKIVENRGGQIWVESEMGKGSTFFFTWPVG
jgi:light-regulated signal transduction histidine kinase (bacteriophytochrome)